MTSILIKIEYGKGKSWGALGYPLDCKFNDNWPGSPLWKIWRRGWLRGSQPRAQEKLPPGENQGTGVKCKPNTNSIFWN